MRMKLHRHCLYLLLCVVFCAVPVSAQWTDVATGITYREFTLPGPVQVFVARADRSMTHWTIDSMASRGMVKGSRETVADMAVRYDDSIVFDGSRYDVKVAINGDYFNMTTGVSDGGQILAGWFAKRYGEYSGLSGFVWTTDRKCFLGGNVRNGPDRQNVLFADRAKMKIDALNTRRGENELALYTPQYAGNTGTDAGGVEVVLGVTAPLCLMPKPPGTKARVVSIRDKAGATPLLFDQAVLSAHGKAATELLRHVKVGQDLHINLELKDYGTESGNLPPGNWRNAYAGIGGPKRILINGRIPKDWEVKAAQYAKEGKKHGSVIQDPRTAIAFDDRYVYFLVIDGRSKASIGMTFTETAIFCKDELKATHAILQDGGGSSTLWLDGKIMNNPSGKTGVDKAGALRPVANGWMIALVLPPKQSDAFKAGQTVRFKAEGDLRTGPGSTLDPIGKAAANQEAILLAHRLAGIAAKGRNWWFCRCRDMEGWISEDQIATAR